MVSLPTPFRAAVGLVATVVDEAKRLPDRALELPMLAVSSALQMSLRAQQQYAALAVRGEEVLSRREPTDEPPAWAQFDDGPAAGVGALDDDAALAVSVADLVDEVETGTPDPTLIAVADTSEDDLDPTPTLSRQPPVPGDIGADASLFGAGTAQPAADGLAEADEPSGTGAEFESGDPSDLGAPSPLPRRSDGKTVRAPRNTRPSPFDVVGDE
jgi:hypothetical protein